MSYISFQPQDYFNTKLWTGNSTNSTAITGVGFQPDMVWIKNRSTTDNHAIFDAIRGATYRIYPNATDAQIQATNSLHSFDSDGFTLNDGGDANGNGENIVGWNWKANGAGSSNTDGTINTTYTSANTTSGMSIIQYSGNGSAGATIGHGIGVAPKCVIIKRTDTTSNWIFGTGARGFDKFLYLNTTDAETTNSGTFNNTAPSSSVITLGSWNDVNNASGTYIAYAFAEKKGFSKFGSYVGNGSTDGSFIYLGMRSSFIMIKRTDAVSDWFMYDVTRDPLNPNTFALRASGSNAEVDDVGYSEHDHLSNGIKLRQTWDGLNASGGTYIYMAFAESPLVSSNGVPAVAR